VRALPPARPARPALRDAGGCPKILTMLFPAVHGAGWQFIVLGWLMASISRQLGMARLNQFRLARARAPGFDRSLLCFLRLGGLLLWFSSDRPTCRRPCDLVRHAAAMDRAAPEPC